jgi:DNA-binding transcriptional LysR family regulator
MTLRHFQIFLTVCDTMNMTAAAESLYISQSAVSQAIAELENHYEVRLFERLSKRLFLTQAGEKLLAYARQMNRMNKAIDTEMKSMREGGLIRIGASVTVGAYVLPELVSSFLKIHASTEIEVVEDNTTIIEKLLLTDKIDLGLVEGDITSPDLCVIPFAEDELVLICGKDHRFYGQTLTDPKEIEKEKFIVREQGSGTRKTFENIMAAQGLSWKPSWTCNNADTIKMAVGKGLGVSVISRRAVEKEVQSGALYIVPVKGLRFDRLFKIVYHKDKYLHKPMLEFIDLCKQG